jgi:hypothetical protein
VPSSVIQLRLICLVREIRCALQSAPEGRKENSPGRKPGVGLERSA